MGRPQSAYSHAAVFRRDRTPTALVESSIVGKVADIPPGREEQVRRKSIKEAGCGCVYVGVAVRDTYKSLTV
jgi:hypothetical protein